MMAPPSLKPEVLEALPSHELALRPKSVSKGEGTVSWLAREIEVWQPTVRRHLRALRKDGQAHIANWYRTHGAFEAVWAAGPGEDAPQPDPMTPAKTCHRYRVRVSKAVKSGLAGKGYADRYKHHVARAIADDVALRTRINPQHWFSALGL